MRMDAMERRHPGSQQEPDQLPCPRCDSNNTKFCYYNNYNLSQPRHFCKACRRYWTQGGTLRNIPVGGGSRKNSKRSRASGGAAPSPPLPSSAHAAMDLASKQQPELSFAAATGAAPGSFTSLLSTQGPGFLALAGLDDMGGFVMGEWPYNEAVVASTTTGACSSGGGGWGFGGVECGGGFFDGDCFTWPDLSISMPVKGFK